MSIRCVVVDDEPLAVTVIDSYVQRTPDLQVVAFFTNPKKALEFLQSHEVDILFVDIQMPDLTGIELVNQLINKPLVIFTTAYSEFAIDGFKADAIDYLLKPIDFTDFTKAVNKAKEWVELRKSKVPRLETGKDFLFIKSEYKIIRINFSEITYIQGMSEYVKIHIAGRKPIMSLLSLKSLESELPATLFMRVHKSFIVNLQKINVIERNEIVYDDGTIIPISTQYKAQFQEFVEKNFMPQ